MVMSLQNLKQCLLYWKLALHDVGNLAKGLLMLCDSTVVKSERFVCVYQVVVCICHDAVCIHHGTSYNVKHTRIIFILWWVFFTTFLKTQLKIS